MFSVASGKIIKFAYFYQNIESTWIFPITNQEAEAINPVL